ncbi:non-ribosomal peptide synthetase [Paenibacillus sp. OSY-SE]|uniref:non-ribosomal peptide synthetase n=1 Tax=Paenibacillus sp. OSY-SE TaxID=1196323 RepID=UPI0002D92073|nr:non-ribosomal peptide synthetase [Paenibacillus sp. OSY-SE]
MYKLTHAQQRIWFMQKLNPNMLAYNLPTVTIIDRPVDTEILVKSIQFVVKRHSSLRTVFMQNEDGDPVQLIKEKIEIPFEMIDLSDHHSPEESLKASLKAANEEVFNLEECAIKVKLFRLSMKKFCFYLHLHHIVADGWSTGIIGKEILSCYSAFANGQQPQLNTLSLEYIDWLEQQEQWMSSEERMQNEQYWLKEFSYPLPSLNLPADFERPARKSYKGSFVATSIEASLANRLRGIARQLRVSVNNLFLTSFFTLLNRLTNDNDIVIGMPIMGRDKKELEDVVGLFINTLAIRIDFSEVNTFSDLVKKVNHKVLQAVKNGKYPFDLLVSKVNPERNMSHSPVFNTFFQFFDYLPPANEEATSFDLTVFCRNMGESIECRMEYSSDLFKHATIEKFQRYLLQILRAIAESPDISLKEIEILSEEEMLQILVDFNQTDSDYPDEATLQQLFEEQVEKTPDNIAVRFNGQTLTYSELNNRANYFAEGLRERGVKEEDIVAIHTQRSLEMIVGILAILKAGAAYLPIDPSLPQERIQYLLEDSGTDVVITQYPLPEVSFQGHVFLLNAEDIPEGNYPNLMVKGKSNSLAYVIYTSGTTGFPKGVLIEHASIINRLHWMQNQFPLKADDVILQKTIFTFDVSVWELFWWMLSGASACLLEPEKEKEPDAIIDAIEQNRITTIHFVPSMLQLFLEAIDINSDVKRLSSLKRVFSSGEALSIVHVKKFNALLQSSTTKTELINLYGPTEAAVDVTYYVCTDCDVKTVPIGKPIDNIKILILDQSDRIQPVGVTGELCISGVGLARGYHKLEELTAKKFVDNRYLPGQKIYRTGDLAKWREDGSIDYIGRIDNQVKIRGYRIELGEIENQIITHSEINKAAVTVHESSNGFKTLIAFYVATRRLNNIDLRNYLVEKLPAYMIPHTFVQIDSMPVTANGKLDRKLLMTKRDSVSDIVNVKPQSYLEMKMLGIWKNTLNSEQVGIYDNFFLSGGDSIKALRLINAINLNFSVKLSLADLYSNQTVHQLITCMNATHNSDTADDLENGLAIIEEFKQNILQDEQQASLLPADYEDFYPLSKIQHSMFYYSLLKVDEPVYHDQFMYQIRIKDGLDITLFKQAIQLLCKKHPILRTTFHINGFKEPIQILRKDAMPKICFEDISHLRKKEQKALIQDKLRNDLQNKFASQELLWYITVFRMSEENYSLFISCFHAILDGWSAASMDTELLSIYNTLKQKKEYALVPLKSSYKDYVAIGLAKELSTDAKKFWKNTLKGYTRNKMPFNISGKKINNISGIRVYRRDFDSTWLDALDKQAYRYGCTLKEICFAAHIYLLSILTGESEIITGVVTHERPILEDSDKILGCFLNTIPARIQVNDGMTKQELISQVRSYLQNVKPYEVFLGEIANIIGDFSTLENPIFDTMFNFTDFHIRQLADYSVIQDNAGTENYLQLDPNDMTNTPFDVEISRMNGRCFVMIKYSPSYFMDEDINEAFQLFIHILELFAQESVERLSISELWSEKDRMQMINGYCRTFDKEVANVPVHCMFEEKAILMPHAIAIKYENKEITYEELNKQANRLAHRLKKNGIGREEIVGVMMERSPEMVAAILAIWKAGGAYLPIDRNYPNKRIQYILENSRITKLITDATNSPIPDLYQGETICLDLISMELDEESVDNLECVNDIHDLAYVIYTSGSTGQPKGAMIEHIGMLNHIDVKITDLEMDSQSKIVQNASHCFDVSVWQFFAPLILGGTMVIYPNHIVENPPLLIREMQKDKITILELVPSQLVEMLEHLDSNPLFSEWPYLKYVILMGEALKSNLVERWYSLYPHTKMINAYGATEASDDTTHYVIDKEVSYHNVPIGKPIPNFHIYVMDPNMNLCPRGVVGELYFSGFGVGRGYLNNHDKTKASFMKDPFFPGRRLYKTGDFGRLLPDGNLEFLGRKDYQIKIRGNRVEIEEIENQLLNHSLVKGGIVIDKEDNEGNKYLIAYYMSDGDITMEELRDFLSQTLPNYMIPAYFVRINNLPLTDNGKVDRKALPDVEWKRETGIVKPANETEEILLKIWEELICIQDISIEDNFFHIGGHSLKAISMAARIFRAFQVEIPLKDIIRNPTIRELAMLIKSTTVKKHVPLISADSKPYYALSSAQRMMFTNFMVDMDTISYNVPLGILIEGALDKSKLNQAVHGLISRHEILRTTFSYINGNAVQQIHDDLSLKIEYYSVGSDSKAKEIIRSFIQPFDLEKLPLFRVGLIRLQDDKHILVFDLHHIICDGYSLSILTKEFSELYTGKVLPEVDFQYKDYTEWQQLQIKTEKFLLQEQFWLKNLSGNLPRLELPTDFSRPLKMQFGGARHEFSMPDALSSRLFDLSRKTETTLYMVILACFNVLLSKYAEQEEIIIGTPVAGRAHVDLEQIIGVFINMIPMRNYPRSNMCFTEFLMDIKNNCLNVMDNQDYPFDLLVKKLSIQREVNQNPIFDVLFVMQNTERPNLKMDNLNISPYGIETDTSKMDLILEAVEQKGEVRFHFDYSTELFTADTIQKMADDFLVLLDQICEEPQIKLKNIFISDNSSSTHISNLVENIEFNF